MVYGYLRVSTEMQDENVQKIGVDKKAELLGLVIQDYIIDRGISGTKEPEKRELGRLLKLVKDGDIIIASELSRLGRNMYMVMRILEFCMKNNVKVITVKDNYELGDNIQSKVLAFAFGIAAEIERDLFSKRVKEGLARRKALGITLGRPHGSLSKKVKLTGKEKEIAELRSYGVSVSAIARKYDLDRLTVCRFMKRNGII